MKECSGIYTLGEFKEFIRSKVRKVFPHEVAACYIAKAPHRQLWRLINVDFPREYLHGIVRHNREIRGPIAMWLRQKSPLFIRIDDVSDITNSGWVQLARKHDIQTTASHGLFDVGGKFFSYFSFGRIHPSVHEKYEEYLNFLVPHLHATLVRLLAPAARTDDCLGSVDNSTLEEDNDGIQTQGDLTQRESEILAWVCVGKTNWEISRIFNISENTVKNHVQNIYKKLGVTNRTQAAGKAVMRTNSWRALPPIEMDTPIASLKDLQPDNPAVRSTTRVR
jgi:transcriptional regulator EpsA